MKKQLAVLGSTGSIGRQTLEVVREHQDLFGIEVLTTHQNIDLLTRQAIEFQPNAVVVANPDLYKQLKDNLCDQPIKVFAGADAIQQVVEMDGVDLVLNALVGFSGMMPAIRALSCGKRLALANKESLVVAGQQIMSLARQNGVLVLPVDSEHSAIFQCLVGEDPATVEKIWLTASGGPFRGKTRHDMGKASISDALNHPNWSMGNKITIDSATMMNKGLEVIEAHWLFGLEPGQIEVVVHPQSVIHSAVQFTDGSVKAQMGVPDMRLPIQYALSFPIRIPSGFPRMSFSFYNQLTFELPDPELFPSLGLAYRALAAGGTAPCILNAANEIAVHAFLHEKLPFLAIPDIIGSCLDTIPGKQNPSVGDLLETHSHTLRIATELTNSYIWKS